MQVTTVWKTEDRIGAGAFGVVWRQKANTGKLRAVKVIARDKLNLHEVEALIDLQDVCDKKKIPPPLYLHGRFTTSIDSATAG